MAKLDKRLYTQLLDRINVQMNVINDFILDHDLAETDREMRRHIIASMVALIKATNRLNKMYGTSSLDKK